MKVVAINGSPRKHGNTAFALETVGRSLVDEGIDFEIIHTGGQAIRGCRACEKCIEMQNGKCAITTDMLNETLPNMRDADGILLGSPVYYSGIAGTMKCFLDRCFFVAGANGGWFRHKVGAAVAAVRRTGGNATFDGLNHYLSISEMLIASSNYWHVIHGMEPGEAAQDEEGVQIMQVLGRNMAWMLKMRERAKDMAPAETEKVCTNFIR